MEKITSRVDKKTLDELIEISNQEDITLSETIRNLLEKQTNNKTPTHQTEKATKEQASNKETITQEQLQHWVESEIKKQNTEKEIERQLNKILEST